MSSLTRNANHEKKDPRRVRRWSNNNRDGVSEAARGEASKRRRKDDSVIFVLCTISTRYRKVEYLSRSVIRTDRTGLHSKCGFTYELVAAIERRVQVNVPIDKSLSLSLSVAYNFFHLIPITSKGSAVDCSSTRCCCALRGMIKPLPFRFFSLSCKSCVSRLIEGDGTLRVGFVTRVLCAPSIDSAFRVHYAWTTGGFVVQVIES